MKSASFVNFLKILVAIWTTNICLRRLVQMSLFINLYGQWPISITYFYAPVRLINSYLNITLILQWVDPTRGLWSLTPRLFLSRVGHVVRDSQSVPQQSWLCGPLLLGCSSTELAVWSLNPALVLSRTDCVLPDSRAGPQQSWLCAPWLPGWSSAELAVCSLTPGLFLSRVGCVVPDSRAGHQQSWLCSLKSLRLEGSPLIQINYTSAHREVSNKGKALHTQTEISIVCKLSKDPGGNLNNKHLSQEISSNIVIHKLIWRMTRKDNIIL